MRTKTTKKGRQQQPTKHSSKGKPDLSPDEKVAKQIEISRNEHSTKRQEAKTLSIEKFHFTQEYFDCENARLISLGVLNSSKDDQDSLQSLLEEDVSYANIRENIETENRYLSQALYPDCPYIKNKPFEQDRTWVEPSQKAPWIIQKSEQTESIQNESAHVAKYIARGTPITPGEDEIPNLQDADKTIHQHRQRNKNEILHNRPTPMAGFKLAYQYWRTSEKMQSGSIDSNQAFVKMGNIIGVMQDMVSPSDGQTAPKSLIKESIIESFQSINTLRANDKLRQRLNLIARNQLEESPDKESENSGLKMLSNKTSVAYRSITTTPEEKRKFWSDIQKLTKDPLNSMNATRLMAVQLETTARENKELVLEIMKTENQKGDKLLEKDQQSKAAQAEKSKQEWDNEARSKRNIFEKSTHSLRAAVTDPIVNQGGQDLQIKPPGSF